MLRRLVVCVVQEEIEAPAGLLPILHGVVIALEEMTGITAERRASTRPRRVPDEHVPRNAGASWTDEDDRALRAAHLDGHTIEDLMDLFGRSEGGIRSRLKRLGFDF